MNTNSDEFKEKDEDQIEQWLKKLERESWQLELLVSAFTIFLLIQANTAFYDFFIDIPYRYKSGDSIISIVYVFAGLLGIGIQALTIFLVIHLLLRGFWIGAIGLRSVQSKINFKALNYSELFTRRLSERVISLDKLVIFLDEICSVIFSFSFLIISMLIAFGTYLTTLTFISFIIGSIPDFSPQWLYNSIRYFGIALSFLMLITGIIYFVDYFTLGFFKKIKWFGKVYYPFYRFYGFITFSSISRSIYYYLISKFTKRKIRLVYLLALSILVFKGTVEFDHYQYYPASDDRTVLVSSYYDNLRDSEEYIDVVSISGNVVKGSFMQLFLRYDPSDNDAIRSVCKGHETKKREGINPTLKFNLSKKGLQISGNDYAGEDNEKLLECLSSIYQVSINDSVYTDLSFYFHKHSVKDQNGLITMIPTKHFISGENKMIINKLNQVDSDRDREDHEPVEGEEEKFEMEEVAFIPFWFDDTN
ncbi:MAG: hypothetical protein AAF363_07930 [Bacteroidota bacterium]